MGLDRTQLIGIFVLFGLFLAWSFLNAPSKEELAERKRIQDSIAMAEDLATSAEKVRELSKDTSGEGPSTVDTTGTQRPDPAQDPALQQTFGPFAQSASGTDELIRLENEKVTVTFSKKGGRIRDVKLKDYDRILVNDEKEEYKVPLHLLNDEKNVFEYLVPVAGARQGLVSTGDLYFQPQVDGNTVRFVAQASDGSSIVQVYTLNPDSYHLDYDVEVNGLRAPSMLLNWKTHLQKVEKNSGYERYYTTVYYKETDDDPDNCNCRKSDTDDRSDKNLKWVSHSNQFFNTTLIADQSFGGGVMETEMLDEDAEDLKILRSEIEIPLSGEESDVVAMAFYVGPNEFQRLRNFGVSLEDIIPFGRSIFGTINRWVIRPIFDFLSKLVDNKGIVILLLTFLVKLALSPLTYRMLYSQAKMSALKPQLSGLREKYKDDMQKQQMETMRIYREFGVSPLGGCLPMVAQMPIWFALYRFFPASIEFRQAGFLWATDLSSYDVFFNLPFDIPFYGGHVSLLTLLWVVTTLVYTYYNTRHMDMASMNPMMKYMQYFMPVMFLFFFNNYASGLTLYLLFSNILNIGMTVGIKKFVFDDEKILAELQKNKEKPKKKGGFQQRLESALKEQQRIQQERESSKKKK